MLCHSQIAESPAAPEIHTTLDALLLVKAKPVSHAISPLPSSFTLADEFNGFAAMMPPSSLNSERHCDVKFEMIGENVFLLWTLLPITKAGDFC